jgi:hypothetical protein
MLFKTKEASPMSSSETRKAVEGYFNGWTQKRVDEAYSWLDENLHFAGPGASYEKAADFKAPLAGFAAMTKSAEILELFIDGDRAAMLYDCDLAPIGVVRIASFFRVRNGKIVWYETQFDASKFPKRG